MYYSFFFDENTWIVFLLLAKLQIKKKHARTIFIAALLCTRVNYIEWFNNKICLINQI